MLILIRFSLSLLSFMALFPLSVSICAQEILVPNITYTQNFNSMGSSLLLPSNWRISYNDSTPTWEESSSTVSWQASSGSPTSIGTYNWASSDAIDRAVGVLQATGGVRYSSLIGYFTTENIPAKLVRIQFTAEQYYKNNADMYVSLSAGTDGSTWTPITGASVGPFPWSLSPTYTFSDPWHQTISTDIDFGQQNPTHFYVRFQFWPFWQGIAVDDVSVTVTNANSFPTNIFLSNGAIEENNPIGLSVGSFSTQDPDLDNTFTYTLVDGYGGDDNDSFTISESNLLAAAVFNYEIKSNYSICVQSADQGGLSTQAVFSINIVDIDEPAPSFAEVPIMSDGNIVIRWGSLTNKQYTIHYSTNLLSGFTALQSNIPATPSMNSYTDSLATFTQKYWKVTTDE